MDDVLEFIKLTAYKEDNVRIRFGDCSVRLYTSNRAFLYDENGVELQPTRYIIERAYELFRVHKTAHDCWYMDEGSVVLSHIRQLYDPPVDEQQYIERKVPERTAQLLQEHYHEYRPGYFKIYVDLGKDTKVEYRRYGKPKLLTKWGSFENAALLAKANAALFRASTVWTEKDGWAKDGCLYTSLILTVEEQISVRDAVRSNQSDIVREFLQTFNPDPTSVVHTGRVIVRYSIDREYAAAMADLNPGAPPRRGRPYAIVKMGVDVMSWKITIGRMRHHSALIYDSLLHFMQSSTKYRNFISLPFRWIRNPRDIGILLRIEPDMLQELRRLLRSGDRKAVYHFQNDKEKLCLAVGFLIDWRTPVKFKIQTDTTDMQVEFKTYIERQEFEHYHHGVYLWTRGVGVLDDP